jgi:hypothetical protein
VDGQRRRVEEVEDGVEDRVEDRVEGAINREVKNGSNHR